MQFACSPFKNMQTLTPTGTNSPKRSRQFNPAVEIIRGADLPFVVGMSAVTVWRWRKAGTFPAPIQLGKTSIGWRRADIEKWLSAREAGR